MKTVFKFHEELRQFLLGKSFQTQLTGFDMGNPQQSDVGSKRRNGSGLCDFNIRNVNVFGNNEGCCTHNRRC